MVKQEMKRVNTDILRISEQKWTGMSKFNSDYHYINNYGQKSLRRHGIAIMVNKSVQNAGMGCNLKNYWMPWFIPKAINSTSQESKSVLQSLMLKKLKLTGSMKTYKT